MKQLLTLLHDIGYALRYTDRILLLHNGGVVYAGSPAKLPAERLTAVYGLPVSLRTIDGVLRTLC